MEKKNLMNDFLDYMLEEQESIEKAVLEQIEEKQTDECFNTLDIYLFHVRNLHIAAIQELNRSKNKYIKLINEELAKRDIFINSTFIHISMHSIEDYGKKD